MRKSLRHPLIMPLLLTVLLVRALFPTGWMPMAEAGAVQWRICPEFVSVPVKAAPAAMAMPHHSGHHEAAKSEPASHGKDSCPFGVLAGMGGTLGDGPVLATVLKAASLPPQPLADLALQQRRWLSHALARGPPAFA